MPIVDLPNQLLSEISKQLSHYTIGFLRVRDTPTGQEADLLGSGTLVRAGATRAIVTADHVVEVLPTSGRLGIILSQSLAQHTVDVRGLNYIRIARGEVEALGPDLGAVVLTPTIASTIGAMKTFYNLDAVQDQMRTNPPDLENGIWFDNGFVAERTIVEGPQGPYTAVKGFFLLSGGGGPNSPAVQRDNYDYISLPITYGVDSEAPVSFGGMSGGGLWQVRLRKEEEGLKSLHPLLSGVVFYQEPTQNGIGGITCHFRKSVYDVVYHILASARIT